MVRHEKDRSGLCESSSNINEAFRLLEKFLSSGVSLRWRVSSWDGMVSLLLVWGKNVKSRSQSRGRSRRRRGIIRRRLSGVKKQCDSKLLGKGNANSSHRSSPVCSEFPSDNVFPTSRTRRPANTSSSDSVFSVDSVKRQCGKSSMMLSYELPDDEVFVYEPLKRRKEGISSPGLPRSVCSGDRHCSNAYLPKDGANLYDFLRRRQRNKTRQSLGGKDVLRGVKAESRDFAMSRPMEYKIACGSTERVQDSVEAYYLASNIAHCQYDRFPTRLEKYQDFATDQLKKLSDEALLYESLRRKKGNIRVTSTRNEVYDVSQYSVNEINRIDDERRYAGGERYSGSPCNVDNALHSQVKESVCGEEKAQNWQRHKTFYGRNWPSNFGSEGRRKKERCSMPNTNSTNRTSVNRCSQICLPTSSCHGETYIEDKNRNCYLVLDDGKLLTQRQSLDFQSQMQGRSSQVGDRVIGDWPPQMSAEEFHSGEIKQKFTEQSLKNHQSQMQGGSSQVGDRVIGDWPPQMSAEEFHSGEIKQKFTEQSLKNHQSQMQGRSSQVGDRVIGDWPPQMSAEEFHSGEIKQKFTEQSLKNHQSQMQGRSSQVGDRVVGDWPPQMSAEEFHSGEIKQKFTEQSLKNHQSQMQGGSSQVGDRVIGDWPPQMSAEEFHSGEIKQKFTEQSLKNHQSQMQGRSSQVGDRVVGDWPPQMSAEEFHSGEIKQKFTEQSLKNHQSQMQGGSSQVGDRVIGDWPPQMSAEEFHSGEVKQKFTEQSLKNHQSQMQGRSSQVGDRVIGDWPPQMSAEEFHSGEVKQKFTEQSLKNHQSQMQGRSSQVGDRVVGDWPPQMSAEEFHSGEIKQKFTEQSLTNNYYEYGDLRRQSLQMATYHMGMAEQGTISTLNYDELCHEKNNCNYRASGTDDFSPHLSYCDSQHPWEMKVYGDTIVAQDSRSKVGLSNLLLTCIIRLKSTKESKPLPPFS